MEALDLAAGLGVVGPRVLGGDPEAQQLGLHGPAVVAPGGGGEDGAVVGQEGLWVAAALTGPVQGPHHVRGARRDERTRLHA